MDRKYHAILCHILFSNLLQQGILAFTYHIFCFVLFGIYCDRLCLLSHPFGHANMQRFAPNPILSNKQVFSSHVVLEADDLDLEFLTI